MRTKTTKFKIFILLFAVFGCKKEQPQLQPQSFYKETITSEDIKTITPEEAKTFHKDIDYRYEYRTGTSGNYEYTYDVNGSDEEGNSVSGTINIEDKYGAGTLTNSNNEEIDIQAEWISNGKLKATDENGNEYELEVN